MWFEHDFGKYKVWKYTWFEYDGSGGYHTVVKITKYKKDKKYDGHVFAQEYSWKHKHEISGSDLDVTKLKCMVLAKEIGWDIKSVT
mgnify:CR=1 FL=1